MNQFKVFYKKTYKIILVVTIAAVAMATVTDEDNKYFEISKNIEIYDNDHAIGIKDTQCGSHPHECVGKRNANKDERHDKNEEILLQCCQASVQVGSSKGNTPPDCTCIAERKSKDYCSEDTTKNAVIHETVDTNTQ